MSEDIIVLEDVWIKHRGQKEYALKGINLKVRKGERLGIIGPTGAGKSTLCTLLNGLIPNIVKVKKMVAKYLPGIEDGELIISLERSSISNSYNGNGKSFFRRKTNSNTDITRKIVTLRKKFVIDKKVHNHVARFTLNERGKVIKMTFSK